jgi:hypothetical protein
MKRLILGLLAALCISSPAFAASYVFQFESGDQIVISDSVKCRGGPAWDTLRKTAKDLTGVEAPKEAVGEMGSGQVTLKAGTKIYACWSIITDPAGRPYVLIAGDDGKADLIPAQVFRPLTES